jgi:predicted negative regulator of RcsB-dependent stress response
MAYDLDEQEQLAQLKAFWAQYGNLLTWVLTACLATYAAWNGWNYLQQSKSQDASKLYDEVQKAAQTKDAVKMIRAASDMEAKYPGTSYASMTGLLAAKVAYDANDLKTAKTQLQWVVEQGKDEELQVIAKLRLTGLLLDEKNFDAAMKLLESNFPAQFAAVVADRKGDVLVAQKKLPQARTAYQLALDKTDKQSQFRQLIQIKLDAIGGSSAVNAPNVQNAPNAASQGKS